MAFSISLQLILPWSYMVFHIWHRNLFPSQVILCNVLHVEVPIQLINIFGLNRLRTLTLHISFEFSALTWLQQLSLQDLEFHSNWGQCLLHLQNIWSSIPSLGFPIFDQVHYILWLLLMCPNLRYFLYMPYCCSDTKIMWCYKLLQIYLQIRTQRRLNIKKHFDLKIPPYNHLIFSCLQKYMSSSLKFK